MRRLGCALLLTLSSLAWGQVYHDAVKENVNVFQKQNVFQLGVVLGPVTFANLGTIPATEAAMVVISDGTPGATCTGGGTGALAIYLNGVWICTTGGGGGGGGTITGATLGGGLVVTGGATLGLIPCAPSQVLSFNGSVWGCSSAGSGTITGGGTNRTFPIFTGASSIGNSPLSYDGTTFISSLAALQLLGAPSNAIDLQIASAYTLTNCLNSAPNFFSSGSQCNTERVNGNWPLDSTGNQAAVQVFMHSASLGTVTGTPVVAAIHGDTFTDFAGGTVPWMAGLFGYSTLNGTGGTVSNLGGVFGKVDLAITSTQTATNAFGVGGQVAYAGSLSQPLGAALLAYSPLLTGPVAHVYGLYIQDQTPGGANNPDPWGIFQAGGAKNQFGGPMNLQGNLTLNITGLTQCLNATPVGLVQGTGAPCSSVTFQTGGVTNLVQSLLDNATSSVDVVGLTVTPTYHTGGHVQYEVSGASYVGNSKTTTAFGTLPTNCGTNSAATGVDVHGNAVGCFSPTGLSGLTQYGPLYALSSTTATTTGPGLIGQTLVSDGTAGPPIMAGPGLSARAIITGTSTDTILCDSATSTRDRGLDIIAANGTTLTETIPDAGTSGCGGNFVFEINASPINVSGTNYAASTVVTVNNTSASKFYISNGLSVLSAQTTFTVSTGQKARVFSPDNVNWLVQINVPTSLTTNSGGTVGDLAAWSTSTNIVNATAHNVATPLNCPDSSGSATAQSCATPPSYAISANDFFIYTTTTTNTGALTTAINGGSALPWKKWQTGVLVALVANDIKANEPALALYDGTNLILQSPGNITASGTTPINSITAAAGTSTIANAANQINWNWALTGASGIGLSLGETSASTGGTAGTQAILGLNTATGSTASPLAIVQGTVNGTTNIPGLNLTGTWSNAALGGPLLQVNVTNTSSAAGSCEVEFFAGSSGTTEEFCFATNGNLGSLGGLQALVAGGLTEVTGGLGSTSTAVLAGLLLLKGSDVNSTGAGAKGGGLFAISGGLTNSNPNASALEGLIQLGSQGLKGSAIAAVYDVVCFSATAYTYTDCGTSSLNVAGIASTSANPIGLITMGESPVNSDNAATIGHIFCTSATTAGDGHDNGTVACPYPQVFIGIVKQTAGTVTTYTSGQNTGTQALSTTIPLIQLDVIVPGGCGAQCVLLNAINVGTAAMTLNMSASTSAPSVQLPAVIGGTILAGTSTANLSAPIVIQNTNSTNNNTSITMGITAPGTSTGQTVLNINGATTGGDLQDWGTGGTWTAGVLSGQTIVGSIGPTGILKLGTAPAITAGSSGGIGFSCGTAPTGVASSNTFYCNSANQPDILSGTTDLGIVSTKSQTAQIITADWTCGTGGTVSSCTTAQTIGTLTFTLPLVAANWTFDCNLIVGQATGVTANNWNVQTATNGATNVTAYYSQATAAAAVATGATTGQGSTTTTFNIGGTWTQGATGTKMPVHIWGTIEGASASGTVFNLQLVAPTVGDLVTIYRGSSCRIY